MTVPKIFSLLRPPLGGGADATRRARELGAPFRVAVALLVAALAFGAAMAGNFGDNPVFAQTTMDYDDDDDGLIDVRSLAQLNAVRHDLNGNGDATHADYVAAFPNRVTTANARMGCPTGTCTGYELRAHLDFDTDGDGSTYTGTGATASGDSGDAYYNSDNGLGCRLGPTRPASPPPSRATDIPYPTCSSSGLPRTGSGCSARSAVRPASNPRA